MDTLFQEFPNSMNRFIFDHASVSLSPNRDLVIRYKLNDASSNPNPSLDYFNTESPGESISSSSSSSNSSSEVDAPSNNVTLKFISDVLLEEDLEGKTCMLQDCLALQAAEKSFYDVLGQEYPHSMNHQSRSCFNQNVESTDDCVTLIDSTGSTSGYHTSDWIFDQADLELSQSAAPPTLPDKEERGYSPDSSGGRKNHQREDSGGVEEERGKKHSALSPAESEQSELFDEVLLYSCAQNVSSSCTDKSLEWSMEK
ncbi:GIBBERELLIN-RESPONSIVE PROTEIN putative-RELATED [Salix purpurea]|uniref:GIBBERELLIN-RESPONSIVE PROTEIN putative-RELATED n=1 Tax=Salix purpurea TaxID=77065 RepID=A0A9Q1A2C1_SALPP|nr:GIBBERELLIN-RESPONSIVE PROTEIN putative-RELATED [Salix purpurea]